MTPIPGRYWVIAAGAAVAAHALIAAAVFWQAQAAQSNARDAGRGGVEVSLGPAGGSAGSEVEVEGTPQAEQVQPTEVETQVDEPVEEVDAAEPVVADSRPVEPLDPSTATPVEVAEAPRREQTPPELEEQAVTEPENEPEPESEAPAAVKPEPEVEPEPEPEEQTVAEAEPEPVQPPEAVAAQQVEETAPSVAGADGKAGTGEATEAGSAESVAGGGMPGASPDYMSRLRAWLEKHKRYPRRARQRRQEGTAMLSFVLDRDGRVVEYAIRESSGHRILDEEVAAMIERAQPLPAFPDDMQRSRLTLVVPVQFYLM